MRYCLDNSHKYSLPNRVFEKVYWTVVRSFIEGCAACYRFMWVPILAYVAMKIIELTGEDDTEFITANIQLVVIIVGLAFAAVLLSSLGFFVVMRHISRETTAAFPQVIT